MTEQVQIGLLDDSGAEFSPCRTWRYALWRQWAITDTPRTAVWIGLNPSTADETTNDRTVRRCIKFSQDWNCERYVMLNAYGFRSPYPEVMWQARDPLGPGNDEAIARWTHDAHIVIAAWGTHCPPEREQAILSLIKGPVYCLALNQGGTPKHPLYVAGDTQPQIFRP